MGHSPLLLTGTAFSSHCPSLKWKHWTAEKMPWKYNLLHSRKINKQGHPNFQLELVQNAGSGRRSVPAPQARSRTRRSAGGWKGLQGGVEMARLQGKLQPAGGAEAGAAGGPPTLPRICQAARLVGVVVEEHLKVLLRYVLNPKLPEHSHCPSHTE